MTGQGQKNKPCAYCRPNVASVLYRSQPAPGCHMQTLPGLPSGGSSPVQGSSPDAARAGQSCIQSCCSPSASRRISPSAGLLSLPPANHCLYSIRKERPGNMATEQVRIHVVSLKTHETLLHSSSCTWKQFCDQHPTFLQFYYPNCPDYWKVL
ncbi:hypothetical protein SDC9_121560 [bioreactor metagenome]|uniref:Uncharacterized protein n=1 Tax=bioreactor metagenome TaxID=1076179 RepID=A0A645CCG7_9ZZZZ